MACEQGEDPYLWAPKTKALLQSLFITEGNRILVVGLQGSGKTSLKQALLVKLLN
ncbi:MAG: hypothetical protein ACOC6G_02105 [Thermoproteota archaeon]